MKKNLYFIRHGQTEYNLKRIYQGQTTRSLKGHNLDISLNEYGRQQATEAASRLKEIFQDFDSSWVILSSPLQRAKETAQHIAQEFPQSRLLFDDRLKENYFGAHVEGSTFEEVFALSYDPPLTFSNPVTGGEFSVSSGKEISEMSRDSREEYDLVSFGEGAENRREVGLRVQEAIKDFWDQNPQEEGLILVGHRSMWRSFLSLVCREEAKNNLGNGEIMSLLWDESEGWSVLERFENSYNFDPLA